MSARSQVTLDPALQRRARERAAELGVSFAEYVRRALCRDLGDVAPKPDISVLFDLVEGGPTSDVSRDKDAMIAQAVRYGRTGRRAFDVIR